MPPKQREKPRRVAFMLDLAWPYKRHAELLFDVISTTYERTSVIVTTNCPFEQWTEVLGTFDLREADAGPQTLRTNAM